MAMIFVDGSYWVDSDGATEWPREQAISLAALIERQGYDRVEVVPG